VIENDRQYQITKTQAEKFRAALDQLDTAQRPEDVHPKLWKAQREGMQSQLQELDSELGDYESRQATKV